MKKYTQPATKVFAGLTAVCIFMVIAGVLLIIFADDQFNLILFFLGIGIPLGILFLAIFLANARNYIRIDSQRIVFPVTRAPKLSLKRNPVLFDDIVKITVTYNAGFKPNIFLTIIFALFFHDSLGTKPTHFYTFHLKNGLRFTETFYQYGKAQEAEIAARLKERIPFN